MISQSLAGKSLQRVACLLCEHLDDVRWNEVVLGRGVGLDEFNHALNHSLAVRVLDPASGIRVVADVTRLFAGVVAL